MAPKTKDNRNQWFVCERCKVYLHSRDREKHSQACKETAAFCMSTNGRIVSDVLHQMLENVSQNVRHGFVKNGCYYSNTAARPDKPNEKFKGLPASLESKIIVLPLPVMKLCKMKIGDTIIVTTNRNRCAIVRVWPSESAVSANAFVLPVLCKCLDISLGDWIAIRPYCGIETPATEIVLRLIKKMNNCDDKLGEFLKRFEIGNFYALGNKITFTCMGQTIEGIVEEIKSANDHLVLDNSMLNAVTQAQDMSLGLEEQFDSLNINSKSELDDSHYKSALSTSYDSTFYASRSHSTPLKANASEFLEVASPNVCLTNDVSAAHGDEPDFFCIDSDTKIRFRNLETPDGECRTRDSCTFERVGGMNANVQRLRTLVKTFLQTPERLPQILQRPSGAILFGPAGTGKTMIAKAIAHENCCHFISTNGTELYKTYYGESEAKLKEIFDEAIARAPSLIFIDDIHLLCPKSATQSNQEYRICYSLARLLDDLNSKSRPVFVLAATQKSDLILPTLRRPGRFDEEIEISIPVARERGDILKKILTKMQHKLTENEVVEIADKTHGFVGGDLDLLCRTAALRIITAQSNSELKDNSTSTQENRSIFITMNDVEYALTVVKPSGLKELAVEVPKVYWSEIGGQEEIKQRLFEAVELPLKRPEVFLHFGIQPSSGILMYGPPGCSKTLIAKALATESGINFIAIKGPELFSKWVGDSERAIRELYSKARAAAPCIVFFDEIDALATQRGSSDGGSGVGDRLLTQLLSEMDGIVHTKNVLTIAATNRPDVIDKALMRPGRLDHLIYIPLPDKTTRKEIFTIKFKKMPVTSDVDVNVLAERTKGYSGAEVVAVCYEAVFQALKEDIDSKVLEMKHLLNALEAVTPRIPESMIKSFEDFKFQRTKQ